MAKVHIQVVLCFADIRDEKRLFPSRPSGIVLQLTLRWMGSRGRGMSGCKDEREAFAEWIANSLASQDAGSLCVRTGPRSPLGQGLDVGTLRAIWRRRGGVGVSDSCAGEHRCISAVSSHLPRSHFARVVHAIVFYFRRIWRQRMTPNCILNSSKGSEMWPCRSVTPPSYSETAYINLCPPSSALNPFARTK